MLILHFVLIVNNKLFQFGRWSLLTAGILYGAFHQSRLSKKEAKVREIEAKEKVIRDEKIAKEKAIATAGKKLYYCHTLVIL